MDELHAAIAAHLRAQCQPAARDRRPEDAILAIWRERCDVPHCRYCGKPTTEGDDAFDVEQMRAMRACGDHYAPF